MPITTLDPATALIVVDLQKGTTAAQMTPPVDGVIGNAARLADAFRQRGLPVVLARFDPAQAPIGRVERGGRLPEIPAEFTESLPELPPASGDLVVTRGSWSAFAGTDVHDRLAAKGITQVVLTGVATSFGVESTARAAYDLGYNVVIATDAVADRIPDSHHRAIDGVFRILGETGTTDDILALLAG
ncbi:isochorismatase family cysteine hydrolase [Microbacterium sp.]|uniref:isochorismatase family cysteine hydrolase n=1 Tax=Microbacterium sp. TaxID=51671 RepID=UPI0039E47BDB